MNRYRLSPAASVTPSENEVLLRTDLGTFQLQGRDTRLFLDQILPLLDGSRDAETIAALLPAYTRTSVVSFLELLRRKGLIESLPETDTSLELPSDQTAERWFPEERFFQTLGSPEGYRQVRNARILIAGLEPWGATAAMELAAAGVGRIHLLDDRKVVAEDLLSVRHWGPQEFGRDRRDALSDAISRISPWCHVSSGPLETSLETLEGTWDLVVVGLRAEDLYLTFKVADFAWKRQFCSISGHIDGLEAWIGPCVVPGKSACWNCSRLRRLGTTEIPKPAHDIESNLMASPAPPRAHSFLAPMGGHAGHLLAMEAIKRIGGISAAKLPGRVFIQNLVTNTASSHQVIPMPWCDICGGAGVLTNQFPKANISLNSLRNPEELRVVLEGFVDERFGIVRSLSPASSGVPFTLPMTAMASLAGYTEGTLQPYQLFQTGAGKGLTAVSASLSAVGEAIERYSAARYRMDSLIYTSYRNLGNRAMNPDQLCLYDERQYRQPGFPFHRFSPDQPIHWIPGRWIDNGAEVLVPALLAYFNFQPAPEDYFCQVSSNGLAAGGDTTDAGLRALFELVERDAFMLTWMCQLPVRRIVLDHSLSPGLAEVLHQMNSNGIEVELYLFNSGISIPTVVCLGISDGVRWPAAFVSLASHANGLVAAGKAILELAHVAPYLAMIMRTHRIPATPNEVLTLEDHALYYVPRERVCAFDFMRATTDAIPLSQIEGPTEPLAASCAQLLTRAGVRVAIVDVTSPDVALSPFRVARAIGTDMQPIHFGHCFQRLGNPRLKKLLGGRSLNPNPHPIA